MSLLQALNLPAAPIKPQPIMGITDTQGAEVTAHGARPIAVPAKKDADLDARLAAREQILRDAYARLSPHQERLDEAIAAASGDTKKAMQAQKADVAKHLSGIERQLHELDADRRAAASPATDAKTMNDIIARSKLQQTVGHAVELDRHDDPAEKKRTENRATTTTTSVTDGKATTRVSDRTTTAGPGGVSRTSVESKETLQGGDRRSTSVSRTDSVGKGGYDRETVVRREHDDGDRSSSIEKKDALHVGPDGVSSTHEQTATTIDGKTTTSSKTGKFERGDGKANLSSSTEHRTSQADGSGSASGRKLSGGLVDGKDGIGGQGGAERSLEHTSAGGLKTGAVGGLDGNVTCNIVEAGGTPPSYTLNISIDLGASLSASAGRGDQEGSERKASVKVSASARLYMKTSHPLAETEAKDYVAALKAASGGSVVGRSEPEFAIIHAGIKKGWPAARDMYLALSGKTGSADDVASMHAGDSKEVGKGTKVGASASVDAKGLGIEVVVEKAHDQSMKVTKEKDGSATYESKTSDGISTTRGAKVGVGVAEGGLTFGKSATTSTGYKLSGKPGMQNARQLEDQIAKLSNQAEVDAFAKAHPETVVERTETQGAGAKTAVTAGVGGVKANIDFSHAIEESKTTDASGKVIGTQTKGTNSGGAGVGIGKLKIVASSAEEATANTDADGNTTLDLTKTDSSTDVAKLLGTLPLVGDKKKGALATVTGGGAEDDTDTRDVQGIALGAQELDWLAAVAGRDMNAWMQACDYPYLRDDWRAAANEVRKAGGGRDAVAKALAHFVGKDSDRAKIINHIVRPPGETSVGKRFEFPQSIAGRRADYQTLILKNCERQVNDAAKEGNAGKTQQVAKDLLERLRSLFSSVNSATDFVQPAVKEEMLSAIGDRQSRVETALRSVAGGASDEGSAKAQDLADYERVLDLCIRHRQSQNDCFDKIEAEYHKRWSHEDAITIATLIKQIRDMHSGWTKDYDKLAMLAQENSWGLDTYWKYKPDRERFERAIQGHPGAPTPAQKETSDMRRKPAPAFSEKELAQANRDESSITYKRYLQMSGDLRNERAAVKGLGDRLLAALNKHPNPAAQKLMQEATLDYEDAENLMAKIKPNDMPSMWDFGVPALDLLRKSHAELAKIEKTLPKG